MESYAHSLSCDTIKLPEVPKAQGTAGGAKATLQQLVEMPVDEHLRTVWNGQWIPGPDSLLNPNVVLGCVESGTDEVDLISQRKLIKAM
nr:15914_t:CDS:2 [Entrophospora candida]